MLLNTVSLIVSLTVPLSVNLESNHSSDDDDKNSHSDDDDDDEGGGGGGVSRLLCGAQNNQRVSS